MQEWIEDIKEYFEDVELKNTNKEQRKLLKEKYTYNVSTYFKYSINSDDDFIIKCSDNTFKNIKYYMGLEYEEKDILIQIKSKGEIITIYKSGNKRLTNLFKLLMPDEFCED